MKSWPEMRRCLRKRAFRSPAAARKEITRQGRRKLYVYRCSFCSLWHLTKMRQRRENHL